MKTLSVGLFVLVAATVHAGDYNHSHSSHHNHYDAYFNAQALTAITAMTAAAITIATAPPKPPVVVGPQSPYPAVFAPIRGYSEHWIYSQEYHNYIKVMTPYQ